MTEYIYIYKIKTKKKNRYIYTEKKKVHEYIRVNNEKMEPWGRGTGPWSTATTRADILLRVQRSQFFQFTK